MAFVVPTTFTAIDRMSGPMRGMGKAFDSLADKAQATAARIERSMKKVHDKASSIAGSTALAGAAITAPLMLANKTADEFESKMSNVATLVDTSKESIADMGKEVLKISQRVPVAIDDLTTSLYQIRSAAIPAGEAMNVLEQSARLSVAGLSTATDATNAMTSAINVFKSENMNAAQIADLFFKTVKAGKTTMAELSESFGSTAPIVNAAGVKMRDFQAATAALTLTGLKASEAQHQVSASVMALIKPSSEMEKVFHAIGVKSGKALIDKMGGLSGAFTAVEKAGTKAGVNMAKAWGRKEAFNAVTLLNGSQNTQYIQNLKDMSSAVSDVDEAFQKQIQTSNSIEQVAKNNAQTLAITIGSALSPMLDKLTQSLVPVIQNVTAWIEKNPELTTTIVDGALAIGGLLLVVSGLSTAIAAITSPIGLVVLSIAALGFAVTYAYKKSETFRNAIDGLWQTLKPLVEGVWEAVKAIAAGIGPALMEVGKLLVHLAIPAFKLLGYAIETMLLPFTSLGKGFAQMPGWLKTVGEWALKIATGPLRQLTDSLQTIVSILDYVTGRDKLKTAGAVGGSMGGAAADVINKYSAQIATPVAASGSPVPAVDSGAAQLQQLQTAITAMQNNAQINIHNSAGVQTTVGKNTGIPVRTTTTTGQF